jgi:hypothetical protein
MLQLNPTPLQQTYNVAAKKRSIQSTVNVRKLVTQYPETFKNCTYLFVVSEW